MKAFKRIYDPDRNIIHHMRPGIETNVEKLQSRANEGIRALYEIESEIFAHEFEGGAIKPRYPRYWPSNGDGT
ncbi:MAG TPA: hypothetical protein VEN81_03895, partial [Planctomycetota bacterium]|nr:hypothetical protein [Planctomycetota bacterium]